MTELKEKRAEALFLTPKPNPGRGSFLAFSEQPESIRNAFFCKIDAEDQAIKDAGFIFIETELRGMKMSHITFQILEVLEFLEGEGTIDEILVHLFRRHRRLVSRMALYKPLSRMAIDGQINRTQRGIYSLKKTGLV